MSQHEENDWFAKQVLAAQKSVSAWPAQFRGKDAIASARLPAAPEPAISLRASAVQRDASTGK